LRWIEEEEDARKMIILNIGIPKLPSMATRVLPPLHPLGFHALSSIESSFLLKFQSNPCLFEIFGAHFFLSRFGR